VLAGFAVYRQSRAMQTTTEIKLVDVVEEPPKIEVRKLSPSSRERYLGEWDQLQSKFQDEPEATIRQADRMIQRVMVERGFPTGDFGPVPASVPEDLAEVLNLYRYAHRISVKCETDMISEDMASRGAAAFRALFDNLVVKEASS